MIRLVPINCVSLPWFSKQPGMQHISGRFLIVRNPILQALKGFIWHTSVCHTSLHAIVCFIKNRTAQVSLKSDIKQSVVQCTKHIWFWAIQIHFNILHYSLWSVILVSIPEMSIVVQWKQIIITISHFIWLCSFIHVISTVEKSEVWMSVRRYE